MDGDPVLAGIGAVGIDVRAGSNGDTTIYLGNHQQQRLGAGRPDDIGFRKRGHEPPVMIYFDGL